MYAVNKVNSNLQMVGCHMESIVKQLERGRKSRKLLRTVYKGVGNQAVSYFIDTFQSLLLPLNLSTVLENNDAVVSYVICSGASKHRGLR